MSKKIELEQYLTSNYKYKDRLQFADQQVKDNAGAFLEKLNNWLTELGIDISKLDISSGFRPADINKNIKGSAKKSSHTLGQAIDLIDQKGQPLAKLALSKPELLKKHGLWVENPDFTKGNFVPWLHIDCHPRSDRPINIFNP